MRAVIKRNRFSSTTCSVNQLTEVLSNNLFVSIIADIASLDEK